MSQIKKFFTNRRSKQIRVLGGIIIFLFLLYFVNFFTYSIKNIFYFSSAPLQKSLWSTANLLSSFSKPILEIYSLVQENNELKKENQKLLSQLAIFQSQERSTAAQKEISLFSQDKKFDFIMADTIGLEEDDILSINKGLADGVLENMPVVTKEHVLVGRIFKVYRNFSKIILVSNKNSVVNAKVIKEDNSFSNIKGVIKGKGYLEAYLDLIPIDSEIKIGDVLVTSAIERFIPKDLLIGKIINVQRDDQKPFQQAQISLFWDVKDLDNLFVITNYKR